MVQNHEDCKKYYKNSNTNELVHTTEFTESPIEFPMYFYNMSNKCIEPFDLKGFVIISEKKFINESGQKKRMKYIKRIDTIINLKQ